MSVSVNSWLCGVENTPPTTTKKRKGGKEPVARKRRCLPGMPPRGRDRRVPLTAQPGLQTTRQSSRRRAGVGLPEELSESDISRTTPSLAPPSSTDRTQSIGTTSRRSRSLSPSKKAGLIALPEPITYIYLDPYDSEQRPPQLLQHMVDRTRDYIKGYNILPDDMRAEVKKGDRVGEFDDRCFDTTNTRKAIGTPPPFTRVEEIRRHTKICCARGVNEAGFNCASHHPIGQLACEGSVHGSNIHWANVTTADITPRTSLLPPTIAARPPDSARVDFALLLEPSEKMTAALPFLEPLPGADIASWGPTTMSSVANSLVVACLETKKSGGNVPDAEYQIGIWAYAIFKRLRLLLHDNGFSETQLPCIPLFIANGEKWEVHFAVQDSRHATEIWKIGDIGSALSCKGIYQIVAIIQVVLDDAQTSLRPWFEAHCLPQLRA